jgi:hypothetical protein
VTPALRFATAGRGESNLRQSPDYVSQQNRGDRVPRRVLSDKHLKTKLKIRRMDGEIKGALANCHAKDKLLLCDDSKPG